MVGIFVADNKRVCDLCGKPYAIFEIRCSGNGSGRYSYISIYTCERCTNEVRSKFEISIKDGKATLH